MRAAPPRVSVVMPFLNAERFLDEAIRSVLAQSFADFELVAVDDGSTDGGTAIARRHAAREDGRVRYVEHDGHANRGAAASRNLGVRLARGELVALIDADDVWTPDKLAEQVAIMDAHPELGMVCGAVRYWRSWAGGEDAIVPTGHMLDRVVEPPAASLRLYPLGTAAAPCPSDLLLRRRVLEQTGGFEEHFTGSRQLYEDQSFLVKLYLVAPVYFSSRVWLDYRQHEESCVAAVTRDGRYHEVRRYFLEWLERHLRDSAPGAPRRVRAAVRRALRPYRHPLLHAVATRTARLRRLPRRVVAVCSAAFGTATGARAP